MNTRIEILAHQDDGRSKSLEKKLAEEGKSAKIRVVDVYTSSSEKAASPEFLISLTNTVTQKANAKLDDFDWALEIGYLPGVTDNVGHTASEILTLLGADNDNECYSSKLFLIKGNFTKSEIEDIAKTLSNNLIQRVHIKSKSEFDKDEGMETILPRVTLNNSGTSIDTVNLDIDDSELETIGKSGIKSEDGTRRGPLGMSLLYMKAVQNYFKKEGRSPTDLEIETIAQTWSEHCKHTIFASPIDDIAEGLYKGYIKRATKEIREAKGKDDMCVSVFSDNAGGIIFDENYLITDKVETHNSPSALDPFGGAITGIVGVNRDCIGFGQGAKPIINRYGFCLADPNESPQYFRDKECTNTILPPATIMKGVIEGVEAGGNQSGIPTPQGFVNFDPRFVGKPLVFVGTVGLIPREIKGQPGHIKKANPGDIIIVAGGRVGRDGIHGATFSSEALDEGSPATAVQIGDPITQKKMSDAIIKELRDSALYSAITDNGAGGLSSSVGEMAEGSGGFHVELEKVPLKYPGMAPWEIWISESQERMTMAVPPANVNRVIQHLESRGVEATAIGTYTDSGRAHITWQDQTVMDISMDFLHDGNPETPLKTTFTRGTEPEPNLSEPENHGDTLLQIMGRLNIASKEFISTQYDHNVQGTAVMGPLQGKGRVFAETSITKPVFASPKGVVLSQGLFPRYSDIDTGAMAAAGVDLAVRNAIAAGADLNQLALLDNFCWCSSDEPERLGQLKRAVEAIYELAVKYGTPFISGKDSMYNDFKGYNSSGAPVKISAPPTLLASSIGVVPHIERAISLDPKAVGDTLYLLGETKDELGASEYYDYHNEIGQNVPETNGHENLRLYKLYARASRDRLIASAYALNHGGLGAALAKKAIAGQLGIDADLSSIKMSASKALYSESTGRILVTVSPQNKEKFEKNFKGYEHIYNIGHIAHTDKLSIKDLLSLEISELENAYKATFKKY